MIIGEIGHKFKNFNATKPISYRSTENLLEYDFLIVDTEHILDELKQGNYILVSRRREEFVEFIKYKKIPIITFIPHTPFDLTSIIPIDKLSTSPKTGIQLDITTNTPLSTFFQKYKECFGYSCFFSTYANAKVSLTTPHEKHPLALYTDDIITLPKLNLYIIQQYPDILNDLIKAVSDIRARSEYHLPDWTKKYHLPGEKQTLNSLERLHAKMNELQSFITQEQSILTAITSKKALLTESGAPLEDGIKMLFTELGLELLPTKENRDDIIIKHGERVAVIEVKGVNGTAAEKHAAQLEKWVSEYYEEHGQQPKGILIVNSHREKPLAEREATTFPDQMLKYTTSREHCLLTTYQLLGIYAEVKKDGSKLDALMDELFNTSGKYSQYIDWQEFITLEE